MGIGIQTILGQAADPAEKLPRVMLIGAVTFIGILLIAWIAVVLARKYADRAIQSSGAMLPFTLHDLRQMREAGQLTEAEYERAKSRILTVSRSHLDGDEPEGGEGRGKDKSQSGAPVKPAPADPSFRIEPAGESADPHPGKRPDDRDIPNLPDVPPLPGLAEPPPPDDAGPQND